MSENKTNLILCIYNEIGLKVLKDVLHRCDISNLAVFTHKDAGDIIALAKQRGIWCCIDKISIENLPFKADIISSVYYRFIIGADVIGFVSGKIFNVHPSLLPKFRGCSSVPWAIINGERTTGISYHYINEGVDTGNIILQRAIHMTDSETQACLYQQCMELGGEYWSAAFELVKLGFEGGRQEGESSYYPRGAPYHGVIDDMWSEEKIERFIRAMTFEPYPYAKFQGEEIKTLAEYVELKRSLYAQQ